MSSSDKDRGHARGDLASCVEAFESEFEYIHRALRRHGANDSDADDLAQEVFLIMWRRWTDYDPARPLRPWLAGIAFRVAYNHRDRIAREVPGGLLDTYDQTETPEEQFVSGRVRSLVLQALGQVPEKQRAAMILHHLDGLGVREVARVTKVPLFTAYSRLRAGRRAFAAAVRRLNTIAGAALLPRPEALLRGTPPLVRPSQASRNKVMSRVRALVLLPAAAPRPMGRSRSGPVPAPSAPGASVLPWVAAAVLVGASLTLGLVARGRTSGAPPALAERAGSGSAPRWPAAEERPHQARAVTTLNSVLPAALVAPAWVRQRPSPLRLAEGMVAYWRFDDGRGSPAVVDLSGHANDCTPQRLDRRDWVAGPHGGALQFGGRGFLVCPAVDPLARGGEELTIAAWIRRTGPDRNVRALVSRQQDHGTRDNVFFGLRDGKLLLGSDLWKVRLIAPAPVPRDRWVHVAATRDGDQMAHLYVDGEEVAHTRSGPAPRAGVVNPLFIGAAMNGPAPGSAPNERFVGSMDELVMYDRALSAAEVAALAAGTQPVPSR